MDVKRHSGEVSGGNGNLLLETGKKNLAKPSSSVFFVVVVETEV
jgi:hypothetical protein